MLLSSTGEKLRYPGSYATGKLLGWKVKREEKQLKRHLNETEKMKSGSKGQNREIVANMEMSGSKKSFYGI